MFYILAANCEDAGFLKIILFVKNVINIIQIAIPILLIASLMLDAFKNVTDKEGWNKKIITKMGIKIIAAVSIFLAPALVNIVLSLFKVGPIQKNECWKNANQEYIDSIKEEENTDEGPSESSLAYIQNQLDERHKLDEALRNSHGGNGSGGNTNTDVQLSYTDFPFYSQAGDAKWASYPYCISDRTLHTSGCGAFSFAVVASGLVNSSYTPDVVAKWICANTNSGQGNGTSQTEFSSQTLANQFGLQSETIYDYSMRRPTKSELETILTLKLSKTSAMIINVPNHYIAAVRSKSGKIGIIDSARTQYNKEYTYEEFYNEIITNYAGRGSWTGAWIFTKK